MGVLEWFKQLICGACHKENSAREKSVSEKSQRIMTPISQERVEFLKDRIRVLSAMYTELLNRPAKYIVGQHDLCRAALNAIQSEKLQLTIELDVLTEYLSNQGESSAE